MRRQLGIRSFAVTAAAVTALVVSGLLLASGAAQSAETNGWRSGGSMPPGYSARWDAAVAYFPPAQQIVLFGGSPRTSGDSWRNDTWVLHQGRWQQIAAPPGLTPRGGSALAYDPAIGRLVLFGGGGPAWPPSNQTWLWDGTSWAPGAPAPAGLQGRTGARLAFLPDIGRLVLFAGAGKLPFSDTWLFDGHSWTAGPAAPTGMAPHSFFGMAYDARLRQIVVAGGDGGSDVWLFDGSTWRSGPALPAGLAGRERLAMAYDPALGGDVVFGGLGPGPAASDTWLLRGGTWTQLTPSAPTNPWPAPRVDASIVWSVKAQGLFLVSGFTSNGFGQTPLLDTWWLQ